MSDQDDWVQPIGLNGLRPGEPTDSIFQVLDDRRWLIAEERAAELITCIKPTETSEQRRLAIADYVRKLIMQCFPCQVFTFGSVPLKTYLPDGDIDLTTFSWTLDSNDSWANDVRNMLESEEKRENAEFRVQEVQFIQAEVKIVKCLVENIVVDISFNQIGGLCTLCFLEEVDQIISDNHLFKRSIILIKAWCYYESRILGAHHGLISTYALEALVLYIFHVFNDTFKGPLEVLYRFLEIFSKFDWENFCVSLWGPVPLDSLPELTAEPPRKDSRQLLLDNAFLEKCYHVYGYNPHQEQQGAHFPKRSFNVVDPLRLNNNLGRSVSKGNFFRIRSAFAFGAMKLARLLDCPEEDLYVEVNHFFSNTWQRHGNRIRPDAPCKVPKCIRPSTPDSSKCTVEERRESYNVAAKNASTVHHDSAWKSHACQISSGSSNQIARNHSSPGIADVAKEPASRLRPTDDKNSNTGSTRCDSVNKNASVSEAQGHLNASLSSDIRTSSCSASDYAADSEVSSSSYQKSYLDDHTFRHASKEHFSEEEQERTKMMTTPTFHGFDGHFHLPFNIPSGHLPFAVPPSLLASLSSSQKNVEGMFQGNVPLVDNPWAINMQFTAVPPAKTHYFHGNGMSEMSGTMNGGINPTELTHLGVENKVLHDHDRNSYEGFDLENGTLEVPFDNRQPSIAGHQLQGKHGSFRNNTYGHHYQDNIENETEVENETEETVNSMTLPSVEACNSTLRSRTSGSSWGGTAGKVSSVTEERRERKTAHSDMESAAYERAKIVSEHASTQPDDAMCSKVGGKTTNRNVIDRNERQPIYSPIGHQLPGIELPLTNGMETGIDHVSGERATDNPGVPPFRFIPAGPPVPFLTMLTLYNVPNGTETKSNTQIAENEEPGKGEPNQKLVHSSSADPRRWDTFDSNFPTHWQILMYARSCQKSQNIQRLGYPSQFTHPPTYCIPSRGSVRPLPANISQYAPFTSDDGCYIPVGAPITYLHNRPPTDYQPYVEEMPRYRGTGTYLPLPNPKINVRDRKVSGNRRVNYSYDRNDQQSDKGGNWNHNKLRVAGRNHIQNQYDKGGPRIHRSAASETGTEKSWEASYRRPDSEFTYQSQVDSLHSPTSSQSGSANVAYDTYSVPACSANGGSLMMMYPYGQKVGYSPQPQTLEFGWLGPIELPGLKEYSLVKDASRPTRVHEDLHRTLNDN